MKKIKSKIKSYFQIIFGSSYFCYLKRLSSFLKNIYNVNNKKENLTGDLKWLEKGKKWHYYTKLISMKILHINIYYYEYYC